jgi:hypothetical protein
MEKMEKGGWGLGGRGKVSLPKKSTRGTKKLSFSRGSGQKGY